MHACDPPPDVSLLLLTHAEQHLLHREVLPVVRQLEGERLPAEQLPAALAYLEVVWADAAARARATDAALRHLGAAGAGGAAERAGAEVATPPAPGALGHDPGDRAAPPAGGAGSHPLPARARHYHAAVRALREALAGRVAPLLAAGCDGDAYTVAHSAWRR
jgi:hypothetical protein